MITAEPSLEMIQQWKRIWMENRRSLRPNRKSGQELIAYLASKYVLTAWDDERMGEALSQNITENRHFAEKLPKGARPALKIFYVENEGNGKRLYEQQDKVFQGIKILAAVDIMSGCYFVEGSSMLWDELCAFQGLDAGDIKNYVCVAQYMECRKKFNNE